MKKNIILASKSGVRKKILEKNGIKCSVQPSNVDEESVKASLLKNGEDMSPELISIYLAALKAEKTSLKSNNKNKIVLGADSVIDINGELISKPKDREEALKILKKLNGKTHHLISSVCIYKNGSMIWQYTDSAELNMKKLSLKEIKNYLNKLDDKVLFSYGVYQIESIGRNLFDKIEGNENTVMGLPIEKIKEYLDKF